MPSRRPGAPPGQEPDAGLHDEVSLKRAEAQASNSTLQPPSGGGRRVQFLDSHTSADADHVRDDPEPQGGDRRTQGPAATQEGLPHRGEWQRDGGLFLGGAPEEPEVGESVNSAIPEYEGPAVLEEDYSPSLSASQRLSQQLTVGKARHLEERAESVIPSLLQGLIATRRSALLEIACSPESLLTTTVRSLSEDVEAASRCSWWNSGNLSTNEGVRHVLQRVDLESPTHVWISPPSDAFSPLQNLNQRSDSQQEALQEKRKEATSILVGAGVVFHACVQRGIHVSLELPERCQAWRLPILHSLKQKYSLFEAVTHRCRVGLRNSPKEPLMRKGWKLLTTHQRLSEIMNLPCRCSKTFVHGKCEGRCTHRSELYTKEYTQKVAKAILQEHSSCTTMQECQGQTQLPPLFGEGSCCVCKEVSLPQRPRKCSHCLYKPNSFNCETPGFVEDPQGPSGTEPEEECFGQEEIQDLEVLSERLFQAKDFRHSSCEQLLEMLPFKARKQHRNMLGEKPETYITLGAYSFGNHYGVTRRTRQIPHTVRYLLGYMTSLNGGSFTCTSLVINKNARCPSHRDVNNSPEYFNRLVGLGPYTNGELWVEEPTEQSPSTSCRKVLPDGTMLNGRRHATRHQLVAFPPKAWHGPEPWKGLRTTLTSYVSRGWGELSDSEIQELERVGFKPPQPEAQAFALSRHNPVSSHQNLKQLQAKEKARVQKQLYMLHAATGHGSVKSLVDVLKRRNAHPEIIQMAKDFKCSVCEEKSRVKPRHLSSLEALPPKWHTASADIGHWRHPTTGEHVQFMVIIDEGSRFRVAKVLSKGQKQQPGTATCLQYLREGWGAYFGLPRTLRLDPAGAFRSQGVVDFCDEENIFLDIVPADAHWQIGVCEQAVQGIKEVMSKLCADDDQLSPEEAVAMAVTVFNHREHIRGFSPIQHAFGRSPDVTGRIIPSCVSVPDDLIVEKVQLQSSRDQRSCDWQLRRHTLSGMQLSESAAR